MSDQIATPSSSRAQVLPPELPGVSSLLTLTVSVVVIAALYLAREVLIPVTLAGLLSFVLAPLASLLRRIHVPRVPSVLLAIITALALILSPISRWVCRNTKPPSRPRLTPCAAPRWAGWKS
jgi:hypothetical protein